MHSYQPSIDDMMEIADCDLFIYVGGESDDWADEALEEGTNPDRRVINLLDVLGSAAREEGLGVNVIQTFSFSKVLLWESISAPPSPAAVEFGAC